PRDALGAAGAEALCSLGAAPPDTGRAKQRAAYLAGFSLHAAVHLHANDRDSRTSAATAPALRFRRSGSPNCPTAVSPTGSSAPSTRAARWCCCSGVPRQRRPAPPLRRPRILLQPPSSLDRSRRPGRTTCPCCSSRCAESGRWCSLVPYALNSHGAADAWHGRGLVCYASSGKEGNRRLPEHFFSDPEPLLVCPI